MRTTTDLFSSQGDDLREQARLHERAAREAGADDGLGGLARDVGARAVDLGRVLARESAAAVRAPAAVGVDDDLAPGQARVSMWPADDKAACDTMRDPHSPLRDVPSSQVHFRGTDW